MQTCRAGGICITIWRKELDPGRYKIDWFADSLMKCVRLVSRAGRWTQALNKTWLTKSQATWPGCVSFYLSLFFDQRYSCAGRVTRCDRAKSWRQGFAAPEIEFGATSAEALYLAVCGGGQHTTRGTSSLRLLRDFCSVSPTLEALGICYMVM